MLSSCPPNNDQIEITLIGPGYGECVVIHVEGEWIIIDSCRDSRDKQPFALNYLNSIGVRKDSVKLIACTHWHDDHIAGLAMLCEKYPEAEFACSDALSSREFARAVEVFRGWKLREALPLSSGIEEFSKIIKILQSKEKRPKFALADRLLWRSDSGLSTLTALSPSDSTKILASSQFASLVPGMWTDVVRAKGPSPNHTAVAMHLDVKGHAILLGSDLEEEGNPLTGWSAVLSSKTRPVSKADLYKVAHHGSVTGEHSGIWSTLLAVNPTTLVSPFSRSKNPLPTSGQMVAIKARSKESFLTADILAKSLKRKGAVSRQAKSHNLKLVQHTQGMVRARFDVANPTASWAVECAGSAKKL